MGERQIAHEFGEAAVDERRLQGLGVGVPSGVTTGVRKSADGVVSWGGPSVKVRASGLAGMLGSRLRSQLVPVCTGDSSIPLGSMQWLLPLSDRCCATAWLSERDRSAA